MGECLKKNRIEWAKASKEDLWFIYFTILDIDVTVRSFCWSAFDHLYPPQVTIRKSFGGRMKPPDRSPRDFRPLQSNPWCRHCLCNAYLRLFQGQWWNFWKCQGNDWYIHVYPMTGIYSIYSWHISYVNVWLASSQLAEIHSSRGHCPIVKIVQKPHGENGQEFLRRMRLQFFTHMLPSGI